MEIRDLECFLTLAELLNFSQAAIRTNTSPSALSRIIQRLENELDCPLFIRDTRRTQLTTAGIQFIGTARTIVNQWNQARLELAQNPSELRGTLGIYATVTACYTLLPSLLDDFRLKHPHVEVNLLTGDPSGGIDAVTRELVDAAIVPVPSIPVPRVAYRSLGSTPLVFISNEPGTINWYTTPVILPQKGVIREMIDQWFAKRFIHPRIHAQVSGNEAIIAMVRLGLGIGLVPELVVQNSPFTQGIHFLPPLEGLGDLPLGLAYLEARRTNPILRAFLQLG